jgi:hypothetical protein
LPQNIHRFKSRQRLCEASRSPSLLLLLLFFGGIRKAGALLQEKGVVVYLFNFCPTQSIPVRYPLDTRAFVSKTSILKPVDAPRASHPALRALSPRSTLFPRDTLNLLV